MSKRQDVKQKYEMYEIGLTPADILDQLAKDYQAVESYAYGVGYKRSVHLPKVLPRLHPHRYFNWETEWKVNPQRSVRATIANIEELEGAVRAQQVLRREGRWAYSKTRHEAALHALHGEKLILEQLENRGAKAA